MTMSSAHQAVKILFFSFLSYAMAFSCLADNSLSFGGKTFHIDQETILLDREDIFGSPFSVKSPEEAFLKINEAGKKATLLVAPSVYWLDNPDDPTVRSDKGGTPYAVKIKCDTLCIVGLSDKPEDVVFAVNRGQTQGAIGNYTMFHFKGQSLKTENITFGNYCNVDLVYPRNPDLNRSRRKDAIVQAQIGICDGTDRLFAENCHFISRLNLCPFVGARRSFYDNCYFECTDDALSGSGVYLDCKFTFFSSKPFYSSAETGAVFLNCDITSLCNGTQYFTKVPGEITAIDTRFFCDKHETDFRWTRDTSDIICHQLNIQVNGSPYIIDSQRPELGPELSSPSLKDAYVFEYGGKRHYNILNLLKGEDDWDPKEMYDLVSVAEKELGRKLTGIPVGIRIQTDKSTLQAIGDTAHITATPLLWGAYPAEAPESSTYVSCNRSPELQKIVINYATPEGLTGRYTLEVLPNLKRAPKIKGQPVILYDDIAKCYKVVYKLSGKGIDESTVLWGRVSEEGNTKNINLLRQIKCNESTAYSAKAGDYGSHLVAIIIPKYKNSIAGDPVVSKPYFVEEIETIQDMPESNLSTDFSDIPIVKKQHGIPGVWCFDVFKPADTADVEWTASDGNGWYYGKGFDASTGFGIVQNEKGARMSYVPTRDICSDMTVNLTTQPAKSGGQGFGSATKQYMDICIKFNPVSLDGYALRIERVPDHDRAVRFSLIKYNKGITEVIDKGVISNCYRTPCRITVSVKDNVLSAYAYTEASDSNKCCDEAVDQVELSIPIEDNGLTGFCIQHTGSTGPSSTLISDLNINWN